MDVTYDPSGFFSDLIAEKISRDAALLERAVERALQGGEYGVLALHCTDTTLVAEVHPSVPYGQIFHVPSTASTDEERFAAFSSWRPASPLTR